VANKDTVS